MSSQLESRHFFRTNDLVRDRNGCVGHVTNGLALYAVVEWSDGRREEIDQFDPFVEVIARGESQ